jgi:hypothetical protein
MILRTQPGKQSLKYEAALFIAMVDDKSLERNNCTRIKGREGEFAYPVT